MHCFLYAVDRSHIADFRSVPGSIMGLLEGTVEPPPATFDLHKTWHGLHYLLTGTPFDTEFPLGFLLGGMEVGADETGYGPARVFQPDEVWVIAEALGDLTPEDVITRYNPTAMQVAKIYPNNWMRERQSGQIELQAAFRKMRSFIEQSAKLGKGLVVIIA